MSDESCMTCLYGSQIIGVPCSECCHGEYDKDVSYYEKENEED